MLKGRSPPTLDRIVDDSELLAKEYMLSREIPLYLAVQGFRLHLPLDKRHDCVQANSFLAEDACGLCPCVLRLWAGGELPRTRGSKSTKRYRSCRIFFLAPSPFLSRRCYASGVCLSQRILMN